MKKQVKKVIGSVLVFCLILTSVSGLLAVDKTVSYGRKALGRLPNALALISAYDKIARGVEEGALQINLSDSSFPVSAAELDTVLNAYRNDTPEAYWLLNTYEYAATDGKVTMLFPEYETELLAPGKALSFAVAAETLLTSAGNLSKMDDYEKAKALHDILASHITYSEDEAFGKTAYGAIAEGKADSAGYARAYQYLLGRVGILSYPVSGSADGVPHTWNLVLLDGTYYYTDLSLDDRKGSIYYSYFNMPQSVMKEDHTFYPSVIGLPQADSFDKTYFHREGGTIAVSGDTDAVVNLIKKNGFARVFVMGDNPDAIVSWFTGEAAEIARRLGYKGALSVGYASLGREYHFTVSLKEGETGVSYETSATTASSAGTSATEKNTATGGAPVVDPPVSREGITGADLVLDSDFTLRFYADVDASVTPEMEFTMNGVTSTVAGVLTSSGEYCFSYKGIKPHQMGDIITASLFDGKEVIETKEYSIEQYCRRMCERGVFTEGNTYLDWVKLKIVLGDMLRYGAATQTYIGYKAGELPDGNVTVASAYEDPEGDNSVFGDPIDGKNGLLPAGITLLEGGHRLYFLFSSQNPAHTVLSVEHGEAVDTYGEEDFLETEEGYYSVLSAPLRFSSINDRYTLTLTVNGRTQTATFTLWDVFSKELLSVGESNAAYLKKIYTFFSAVRAYELR